ncbi:MAG: polyphosphate kinase 1 [Gaiellaceae bacterium]
MAKGKLKRQADGLFNRELSWLDFNARVLELAAEERMPLLERVRFCAIFSANLDEFFRVRVAGLVDQLDAGYARKLPDGLTVRQTLADIRRRVVELERTQSKLWLDDLKPALAHEGIVVGTVDECTPDELAELAARFEQQVYPVLTPLATGPGQPFPYISALSLSLVLLVREEEAGEERIARVKVPEGLPRFVRVGSRGLFVALEDVIANFAPQLFPQMEIVEQDVFRVTRDADYEISDEADDLRVAVELELRRRRFGEVVRIEASSGISPRLREWLESGLRVDGEQVYLTDGLLDRGALMQLAALDRPELKEEPWPGVTSSRFREVQTDADVFREIAERDILVHHPYESFATSFGRFLAAARDPDVIGLKATVYRTDDESLLVPALIEAAEKGKQSVCVVELRARFDERQNIEWSRALERVGVHVVYGFPTKKVHAKATLIVRREGDVLRRYVHVGTGNYHSVTAEIYEDFGLFTADPDIAADVADLFNYVTGFGKPQRFRKLLVAPIDLREQLISHIRRVATAADAGEKAAITIKVNSLTDEAIIDELYAASQVGTRITLIVRGICCLRPGVKGMSDNIEVRSILGRFLEHSRIFNFETKDSSVWLLGSADLMPRNLDNRLEVVVPVDDGAARKRLASSFALLLEDNTSWLLQPDGTWLREAPAKDAKLRPAQPALMRSARRRRRLRSAELAAR